MRPGIITLLAGWIAAAAAGSASGTTIELRFDVTRDPQNVASLGSRADGTAVYALRRGSFLQTFTARVVSDNGAPVSGCLDGGAQISLVDSAGTSRASSSCANVLTGLFELLPTGNLSVQTPELLTATLPAPATAGAGAVLLSPATSNRLQMLVQPQILNETPATFRSRAYPIRARLDIPRPRAAAGLLVLQRRRGSTWKTIVAKKPERTGRFAHPVAVTARRTVYRVRFVPARGSGWLGTELRITITRRS